MKSCSPKTGKTRLNFKESFGFQWTFEVPSKDKGFSERFTYTEDHRGRPFVEIQFTWEQKLSGENWFRKEGLTEACEFKLSRMKMSLF